MAPFIKILLKSTSIVDIVKKKTPFFIKLTEALFDAFLINMPQ